jgi:hypothetical protein
LPVSQENAESAAQAQPRAGSHDPSSSSLIET